MGEYQRQKQSVFLASFRASNNIVLVESVWLVNNRSDNFFAQFLVVCLFLLGPVGLIDSGMDRGKLNGNNLDGQYLTLSSQYSVPQPFNYSVLRAFTDLEHSV